MQKSAPEPGPTYFLLRCEGLAVDFFVDHLRRNSPMKTILRKLFYTMATRFATGNAKQAANAIATAVAPTVSVAAFQ